MIGVGHEECLAGADDRGSERPKDTNRLWTEVTIACARPVEDIHDEVRVVPSPRRVRPFTNRVSRLKKEDWRNMLRAAACRLRMARSFVIGPNRDTEIGHLKATSLVNILVLLQQIVLAIRFVVSDPDKWRSLAKTSKD
jgi:hypothetical protein